MTPHGADGRALAIAAGCVFAAGALYILLEDVVKTGNWTMEHAMTVITLLGTIAVGHLAQTSRGLLAKLGFSALFLAGTALTTYTSIGRQAELTDTKVLSAEATNSAIAGKEVDLAKARIRLDQATAAADKEMTGEQCGRRCKDWKLRATEVQANIGRLEADIKALGPQKPIATKADKMAKVLALFGWPEGSAKAALMLIEPFAYSLFFELGIILSFGYGLRPRPKWRPCPKEPEPEPKKQSAKTRPDHPVLRVLQSSSRPLTNNELAAAMGVSKGEATKRRAEVAAWLQETRSGRRVYTSLVN
jgi:hypothetical protein